MATTNPAQGPGDSATMESFQAMLQSLNIPDPTAGNAQITPEMMQRLSERIMSILGDNKPSTSAITEDGLPVVEITEHEDEDEDVPAEEDLPPVTTTGELIADDLVRHDKLSPQERARRLAECNRLLEKLEAEEREEVERERAKARVWAEQKKRESAEKASTMLKPTPVPHAPTTARTASGGMFSGAAKAEAPEKKKSVRFTSEDDVDEEEAQAAGDLVFARLKKQNATTAATKTTLAQLASSTPMKLDVVERAPGRPRTDAAPPSESDQPDSDDETPPSTPSSSASPPSSPAHPPAPRLDEDDLREIEAEYQRRRTNVSLDPSELDLPLAGRSGVGSGTWDEEFVPVDATLASSGRRKPAMSRFKAARLAGAESVSVPEIIPSGAAGVAFQNAIRLGHLKNGELEAAAESESDEDLEKKHAATFDALKNYGMQREARESPVQRTSAGPVGAVRERNAQAPAGPVSAVRERAPPRPAVSNIGPTVVERTPGAGSAPAPPSDSSSSRPKKVSRFKAEQAGQ